MLYLYTENFFFWPRLKRIIKRLVRKSLGGPKGVEMSLIRGLKELNNTFLWNKAPKEMGVTACVLSGIETLKWAIGQKQKGVIRYLVAGPNLVVTPQEQNNLVLSPEIDKYIVPSQWSVDWWSSLSPSFKQRLYVWPAGVEDKGSLVDPGGKILVFQKNAPKDLLRFICSELQRRNKNFQIIFYGQFSQKKYYELLSQTRFMIYLSKSESQGLALHEAWMANVPTLVWNQGFAEYKSYKWYGRNLSAPYLNEKTGLFFANKKEFVLKLNEFEKNINIFEPRKFSLQNFTDKVSASRFLNLF